MFIEDIHTFVRFLENQGESKDFSPEEIDEAVHRSSIDLFNKYRPIFESTSYITSAMRPFKKSSEETVSGGIAPFPSRYSQITNFGSVVSDTFYKGEVVTDAEWGERVDDPILVPEDKDAICRETSTGLEVEPSSLAKVKIFYLSIPVKPKFAYTLSQDSRDFIFDAGNSTDIEWPETEHNEILEGALMYLGVPLRDNLLMQFKQIKQESNI